MQARGHKDIVDAVRTCAFDSNGSMTEYEVYFTWAWHMYRCVQVYVLAVGRCRSTACAELTPPCRRSRIDHVHLPYVLRNPKLCNMENAEDMKIFKGGRGGGRAGCRRMQWPPLQLLHGVSRFCLLLAAGTDVGFVVCHDSLLSWKPSEILYTNCKQKGVKCECARRFAAGDASLVLMCIRTPVLLCLLQATRNEERSSSGRS